MTQYGGSIVRVRRGCRVRSPPRAWPARCARRSDVRPSGQSACYGAKVLPGETDIAVPEPTASSLSRTYSSLRTKTPAPVGASAPLEMPADIHLQLRDNTLILSDNSGGSLYFEHLFPGEDEYSQQRITLAGARRCGETG